MAHRAPVYLLAQNGKAPALIRGPGLAMLSGLTAFMNGILVIDEPAGPTSAEIVRQLKGHLGKRTRVGHLGTLDPFATGVLPILIGEGTKLAPFLQEGTKEYAGLIALGTETDTLDSTGQVSRTVPVPSLGAERLAAIANQFTGTILQT